MTLNRAVRVFGLAVAFATMASDGFAQMFVPTGRDTLRGLPGVEVIVEGLQPEIERDGVSRMSIHGEVASRLRASGIAVYTSQTENPSPAKAYLYVHINALTLPRGEVHVVALQVQLRQTVRSLVGESNIVNAMTWDAHNVFGVPTDDLSSLRAEIQDHVDLFISDWTAVH